MKLGYGPPDRGLLRELRQVKTTAVDVLATLVQTNAVPADFPREVLEDICEALSGLEAGTAENCRPTLEYARNKIPEIRREYFLLDDGDLDHYPIGIDEPSLYRGMPLDIRLNELIGAVATALDEYRVQAQERFDDEVRAEDILVLDTLGENRASSDATHVIEASGLAIETIASKDLHTTQNGDVLTRRLMDSKNLATAARSQLLSRKIIRRWFEGIASAFRDLPELISRAGSAIKVGTDVADLLSDWWTKTEHEILRSVIDQIREFGGTLENISVTLRRTPAPLAASPVNSQQQRVLERREAESEVARRMKAGEEVSVGLAELVEHLQLSGSPTAPNNIPRWKDVARCRNIESLHAQSTNFSIRQHGQLLNALYGLRSAILNNQDQDDVDSAEHLSTLRSLSIQTDATDISSLGHLKNLLQLKLTADQVENIAPIGFLSELNTLSLRTNRNRDFWPLSKLGSISAMKLQSTKLTDLGPLAGLTTLDSLSIQASNVLDIEPLEALSSLTRLSLEVMRARGIGSLSCFPELTSLSLLTEVSNGFSVLGKLKQLSSLSLIANNAIDLNCLENLKRLTFLSLQAHSIKEVGFLAGLSELKSLALQANNCRDGLEALTSLQSLSRLDLTGFDWDWFKHVSNLSELQHISLTGGGIVDLAPLANLKKLKTVRINSVQVLNAGALIGVEVRRSHPRPTVRPQQLH